MLGQQLSLKYNDSSKIECSHLTRVNRLFKIGRLLCSMSPRAIIPSTLWLSHSSGQYSLLNRQSCFITTTSRFQPTVKKKEEVEGTNSFFKRMGSGRGTHHFHSGTSSHDHTELQHSWELLSSVGWSYAQIKLGRSC